jgi:hypothetical protein
MPTDSCERCGSPAPEALLRTIELRVDDSRVDEQTVCPDCFADWIAHYQEQMAGDMPGTDENAGADDQTPSDSALNAAVAAAQDRSESHESPTTVDGASDRGQSVEEVGSEDTGGDEIREVGGGPSGGDGGDVAVDLGGESDVAEEDDEDDDGGLILN